LVEDLLASLRNDATVRRVLVGAHWTVVSAGGCGMAATLLDEGPHGERMIRGVGGLRGGSAQALARYALSDHPMEASIGVAALNALLPAEPAAAVDEVDAATILVERGRGRGVAVVGHFPFLPRLREVARTLWVLELHPGAGELPPSAAADVLPQAEVLAITSTTLINRTLAGLLALRRPDAFVMLLGPSTPLSPVLFDHGIDALSGVRIVDEEALFRTVMEGATFRQVAGVQRVTCLRPKAHRVQDV
jgi:uncharacterized protein (DUF4213/DUF364 family)